MKRAWRLRCAILVIAAAFHVSFAAAGIVARFSFDDLQNLGYDSSGNGFHATNYGAAYDPSGRFGGAASLSLTDPAADNYLELPNTSDTLNQLQNGNYTLTAWVKPSSVPPSKVFGGNTSIYGIVVKDGGGLNGLYYENHAVLDSPVFVDAHRIANSSGYEGTNGVYGFDGPYEPGVWHFVAASVSKDQGILDFYVDGQLKIHEGFSQTFEPGTEGWPGFGDTPWRIGIATPGASNWRWQMDGLIDEVGLWDEALTQPQIAAIIPEPCSFLTWAGIAASGLLLAWRRRRRAA